MSGVSQVQDAILNSISQYLRSFSNTQAYGICISLRWVEGEPRVLIQLILRGRTQVSEAMLIICRRLNSRRQLKNCLKLLRVQGQRSCVQRPFGGDVIEV